MPAHAAAMQVPPSATKRTVGDLVRALRLEGELTVQQMASRAGVCFEAICKIERNQGVRSSTWQKVLALYCLRNLPALVQQENLVPPWPDRERPR